MPPSTAQYPLLKVAVKLDPAADTSYYSAVRTAVVQHIWYDHASAYRVLVA